MRSIITSLIALLFASFIALPAQAQQPVKKGTTVHAVQAPNGQSTPFHQSNDFSTVLNRGKHSSSLRGGPCDTLFQFNFDNKVIPPNWQNIDVDNKTEFQTRPKDWFPLAYAFYGNGDTNWVMSASSWFATPGQAENWLITDSFTVCDPGLFLMWKSAPFEGPTFADGYVVLVSTTDSARSSFTDTLEIFAEGVGATANWSAGVQHPTFNGNNGVLVEWKYSLSAFNGQRIWVAFKHNSDDDNLIMLDDILVGKLPSAEAEAISGTYDTEYFSTPLNQVSMMNFSGVFANNGGAGVTGATLDLDVTNGGGSSVHTATGTLASVPSLTDTVINLSPGYMPTAIDDYNCEFLASMTQADPNPNNDTAFTAFSITDSTFSRDNNALDGSLGFGPASGTGDGGIIGQSYTLQVNDTLTTITFYLNAPTVGDTVYGVVYSMLGGFPGAELARTPDLIISNPTGTFYTMTLTSGPLEVVAGDIFVGVHETSRGENMTLGYSSERFYENTVFVFFESTFSWSQSELLGFPVSFIVRPNFGTPIALSAEQNLLNSFIAVYPNPTSGLLNIDFNASLQGAAVLTLMDLNGRTIAQSHMSNIAHASAKMDLSNNAPGVYFLRIDTEQGTVTRKIHHTR